MIILDNNLYRKTKDIVLGKTDLEPIAKEFASWLLNKYKVKMINFEFDDVQSQSGNLKEKNSLRIILDSEEDVYKMSSPFNRFSNNPIYVKEIKSKFNAIVDKYYYVDASKLSNYFIRFNHFSEEAKTEANWSAISEAKNAIIKKYSDIDIWDVIAEFSEVVVFYLKKTDVSKNKKNGVSNKIRLEYFSILKKHDDLNYFSLENFNMKFDSKENLDKNYKGNLFYYYKR